MPIYEYECSKCGQVIEAWQKFSDNQLTKCDKCKGKLRKLISQNSFHLKGTGWYVTDYTSKSGATREKSTSTEDKSSKKEAKSSGDTGKKKDSSTGGSEKKKDNGGK